MGHLVFALICRNVGGGATVVLQPERVCLSGMCGQKPLGDGMRCTHATCEVIDVVCSM